MFNDLNIFLSKNGKGSIAYISQKSLPSQNLSFNSKLHW